MRSLRGVEQSGNSLENNEKTVLTQACRKELQKMGDSTTIGRPRNSENGTEPIKVSREGLIVRTGIPFRPIGPVHTRNPFLSPKRGGLC